MKPAIHGRSKNWFRKDSVTSGKKHRDFINRASSTEDKNPGDNNEEYCEMPPTAASSIISYRSFGYDIRTSIADLIDNSISAEAKNVWLVFYWNGKNSTISIQDDGHGMTERKLEEAMRFGSKNPLEERPPEDLGRFGRKSVV